MSDESLRFETYYKSNTMKGFTNIPYANDIKWNTDDNSLFYKCRMSRGEARIPSAANGNPWHSRRILSLFLSVSTSDRMDYTDYEVYEGHEPKKCFYFCLDLPLRPSSNFCHFLEVSSTFGTHRSNQTRRLAVLHKVLVSYKHVRLLEG